MVILQYNEQFDCWYEVQLLALYITLLVSIAFFRKLNIFNVVVESE